MSIHREQTHHLNGLFAWKVWLVGKDGPRWWTGIDWTPDADEALWFADRPSAERIVSVVGGRAEEHQWGNTDQLPRNPNPCDKIFDHKYLNGKCVEEGCQYLCLPPTKEVGK